MYKKPEWWAQLNAKDTDNDGQDNLVNSDSDMSQMKIREHLEVIVTL